MKYYDVLVARGNNPQTITVESDSPDHPFTTMDFEDRGQLTLIAEKVSKELAKTILDRFLTTLN